MGNARNVIGDVRPFAVLSDAGRTRVYKGYQPALDRFVLLKVLKAGGDETLVQRFEEEARLVARVQHPNVVAVHAFGRDDGEMYLTAEFVEGADLRELLEEGPLPPDLASFIALQAARGLQAAHARDVLHRDFKPANLLIAVDGQVKVADFGMASLHGAPETVSERGDGERSARANGTEGARTEIRGTPGYLAPEQLLGRAPGPAADFFALGATLYEMLAGRPAFGGAGTEAVLDAVLHHDPMEVLPLHADAPAPLRRVCAKLLAKDPAERLADDAAVIAELEAAREALGFAAGQAELAAYVDDPASYRPPARPSPQPEAGAPGVHLQRAAAAASNAEGVPEAIAATRRRTFALAALGLLLAAGLGYIGLTGWIGSGGDASAAMRDGVAVRRNAAERDATQRRLSAAGVGGSVGDSTADADSSSRTAPAAPPPMEAQVDTAAARVASTRPRRQAITPGESPKMAMQGTTEPSAVGEAAEGAAGERRRTAVREDAAEERRRAERSGRLRVVSVPAAAVYVDGDSIGVTPTTTPLELVAGVHRLALKHPRLPVYRDTVRIAAGRLIERSVTLWAQVARLTVEVSPWAEVLIDGAVRDTTPLERPLVVAPGMHTLTLRHPTLGVWKDRRHFHTGAQDTISVNLLK